MPDMTDELNEIGLALVSAGDGEPLALSDDQRIVLAQASYTDIIHAIVCASFETTVDTGAVAPEWIHAATWTACHESFLDQNTQDLVNQALASTTPLEHLREMILGDDRLSDWERELLQAALARALDWLDWSAPRDGDVPDHGHNVPAYIASIAVQGFRGVGDEAQISFTRGPSLTVVYGANGSGKSTFVDALEVLLSGTAGRFDDAGEEWMAAWSNIHRPTGGQVEVTFSLPTHRDGEVKLSRAWRGNPLLSGAWSATANPTEEMRNLGWTEALSEFRPILGYTELGPLFGENEATDHRSPVSHEFHPRRTPLAHHVALRSGVGSAPVEHFHFAMDELLPPYRLFEQQLSSLWDLWQLVHPDMPSRLAGYRNHGGRGERDDEGDRAVLEPLVVSNSPDQRLLNPQMFTR